MSYTITVDVVRGKAEVRTSGEVPDGSYTVSGHVTDAYHQVSVHHVNADGKPVVTASATRHQEA